MVPTPPGCPVPQAFSKSSASGPHLADRDAVRPQPQRRADQIGKRGNAVLGAQRNKVGSLALKFAGILYQHHPIGGLCDFGQQRIGECGLSGRGATGHQDIAAIGNGRTECLGLRRAHDAGGDVVIEGKNSDRRFAYREGRRCHDRREQALKPLAGFWQLGRHARRSRMYLGANMVCDKAHDAFAIVRGQALAGVDESTRQPIDPESTIRIEHDLDDFGIFQEQRDGWTKCRAQHARAA